MKILKYLGSFVTAILMLSLAGGVIVFLLSASAFIGVGLLVMFILFLATSAIYEYFKK